MIWTLSLALKATVVLTAATAVAGAERRKSAAARHTLWSLALLCLVALPVLSFALPRLELPLLPAFMPGAARPLEVAGAGLEAIRAPLAREAALGSTPSLWEGVLLVWLAGASLALIQLVSGSLLVGVAARRAEPVTDPEWNELLDEAAMSLGVRRRVELRLSPAVDVPNVWGWQSPVVLLPVSAVSWPESRRRAILLHELAHVARHDRLTQTLAYVVRALYWPHPLVWWAVSCLRREAECACDDRVLHFGTDGPEYAQHLLEAARGVRRPASFLTAAAGAEHTRLGARLRALLDEQRDRRVPSRRATALVGGASLLALALLAAADPVAARTPGSSLQATATDDAALEEWIVHEPVGCLIEDRFPELAATIEPASAVAEARLYFSSAQPDAETWYWIGMTATGSRFVGRLPKPRAAASPVRYRIEARRTDGRVASTKRHAAVVAASESQCPPGVRIAPSAASTDAVVVHGSTPRR